MTQSKRVQRKRDLRQLLILLHQYTGFIFAAYLIVVCTSGTASAGSSKPATRGQFKTGQWPPSCPDGVS